MAEPLDIEINTSHYQIERRVLSNRALNDMTCLENAIEGKLIRVMKRQKPQHLPLLLVKVLVKYKDFMPTTT